MLAEARPLRYDQAISPSKRKDGSWKALALAPDPEARGFGARTATNWRGDTGSGTLGGVGGFAVTDQPLSLLSTFVSMVPRPAPHTLALPSPLERLRVRRPRARRFVT